MKIGVVLDSDQGMDANVSTHFGQCPHFLILDVSEDKKTIVKSEIVENTTSHGSGGCPAVSALLAYNITHVIAGGMGSGAQQKFQAQGVSVFGYEGRVQDAVQALLGETLTGIEPCKGHGDEGHSC